MVFPVFIAFVILLRAAELLLARRNARWLLRRGAVEYGRSHYRWIVWLHILFFASLIAEYLTTPRHGYSMPLLLLYLLVLAFKAWAIRSLGRYWNTRIYRIADAPLVRKGPYRFMKHPNYLAVIAEIALIPLIFHLYWTAAIFSLLNALMLSVRIREENRALADGEAPEASSAAS